MLFASPHNVSSSWLVQKNTASTLPQHNPLHASHALRGIIWLLFASAGCLAGRFIAQPPWIGGCFDGVGFFAMAVTIDADLAALLLNGCCAACIGRTCAALIRPWRFMRHSMGWAAGRDRNNQGWYNHNGYNKFKHNYSFICWL